ncbi:hypothetical protein NIES593_00525 [Hydrococcus rivularis NIES-593]|uniref:DUF3611 domain-containing protein n=1 Tax=Hydrococcus rivularis NIES-593 TaxID=1921803 RepID=A0A1U7HSL7_9CYAN|nr:DUF3611 family protein [Hydrococcus rivularis]OKH26586.1 hypothetical protein NIES593_00525 [Hydrococcus rivularis NIES-593]
MRKLNVLKSNSNSPSSVRQQAAVNLRTFGWIGFWTQLVLTVASGLVLLFAIADPNLNINVKSGLGLFSAAGGILILCSSIYWFFRYTRLSRQLEAPESSLHPSRKETVRTLQTGVIINLLGMLLILVGVEVVIGTLLGKTLSVPQGAAIYRSSQLIEPLDIFVVQANINMIVAQFVGIGIPFWLATRIDQH